mmetsp:Transcript_42853/g.80287  ORF Transcript_42853/g.80287 Transcript_42853/m.80287 type:complete len:228 (+) Transcript_42853:1034-1717(+)
MVRLLANQIGHGHVRVPDGLDFEHVKTARCNVERLVQPVKHVHHLQWLEAGRNVGEAYNVREKDGDALVVLRLHLLALGQHLADLGGQDVVQDPSLGLQAVHELGDGGVRNLLQHRVHLRKRRPLRRVQRLALHRQLAHGGVTAARLRQRQRLVAVLLQVGQPLVGVHGLGGRHAHEHLVEQRSKRVHVLRCREVARPPRQHLRGGGKDAPVVHSLASEPELRHLGR